MDIPVVGKLEDALDKIEPLDAIIIDGDNGQIYIRPGQSILQSFTNALNSKNEQLAIFASLRDIPAMTEDNINISINMNAGLLADIDNLSEKVKRVSVLINLCKKKLKHTEEEVQKILDNIETE
mgnify:CR=1 FL=1